MYTITLTGAPYGQSDRAWYVGEMYRDGIRTLTGAERIARKALLTMDQIAHVYRTESRNCVATVGLTHTTRAA